MLFFRKNFSRVSIVASFIGTLWNECEGDRKVVRDNKNRFDNFWASLNWGNSLLAKQKEVGLLTNQVRLK